MRLKSFSIIFTVLLLAVVGCKTTKKSLNESTVPVVDTVKDFSFRKVIRSKEIFRSVADSTALDTAYIVGDTLFLRTPQTRSCDADNFKLFWNGALLKSLPPQTSVKLFHQADTECSETHAFLLSFNIKPVRLKSDTLDVVSENSGAEVVVRVGGWKSALKYKY